jgi:hypothetical protein
MHRGNALLFKASWICAHSLSSLPRSITGGVQENAPGVLLWRGLPLFLQKDCKDVWAI